MDLKPSKFESAIKIFWKASLFIGILVAVIIGFRGNWHSDWIFALPVPLYGVEDA